MSTEAKRLMPPAEYLLQERAAPTKSEYFQGEVIAMEGANRAHNLIVANMLGEVGNQLKDRSCEVYPSDMRVKVEPTGLYTYPDVTIVSEEPVFEDSEWETLLNPTVLIEVLSDSTEAYDRGAKSAQYRRLPSLNQRIRIDRAGPSQRRVLCSPRRRRVDAS